MAGKVSAENVFGQVLICLRMSKLDYLVKETPYAAYVTVRKKFMKNNNATDDTVSVRDAPTAANIVIEENIKLREELKDIKTNCAIVRVENEELEIKNEELHKKLLASDDKLEDAFIECVNLKEALGKANAEKNKLIDHMNEKMNDICYMEEVIQKTKKSYKRFEENDIIQ